MSFSFDTNVIMSNAAAMFNALFPIFAVVIGLGLGIALIGYVRDQISKSV